MSRITDKTLGDACRNPDGKTYDGRKLAQWLFEAVSGKPMSDAEAQKLVDEAAAKAKARRAESIANLGAATPTPSIEQAKKPNPQTERGTETP